MSNFEIIDNKIYDPNGQEFIIKGANIFASEGLSNVDNYLNTWEFNTIRVANYLLGDSSEPNPMEDNYATNQSIVDAYTSQGAVVIFDAHDRIGGYYEGADFEILKDYWRDMAQQFKDNPNVWFNLQNEPGNATANSAQWVQYHREIIDIIRAEGAENMIIVDGEAWGQDYQTQTIANHAQNIMSGNENVMFSIHIYDQWNNPDIGAYLDTLEANGIPIMIGEYASENNGQNTLAASQAMMQAVQEREIGRIAWGTRADDLNDFTTGEGGHAEHFNGTNTEILTELGQLIFNDNQRVEDLEQLEGYVGTNSQSIYSDGTFTVEDSGQIQFDFLFDGGWFQGELAVFSLAGMEGYAPGSQAFVQEAANRALTNTEQGYVVMSDRTEGALFDSALPWENDFNNHEYLGQKTFTMNAGDEFAVMLIQHITVQEIANNPGNMWQWGKLPLFSIPEANPGGVADGQMVSLDENGTYYLEDMRVDWGNSDKDYNDVAFQLLGATANAPHFDERVNGDRDWRTLPVGQSLLDYAANSYNNFYSSALAMTSGGSENIALASAFSEPSTSLLRSFEPVTSPSVLTTEDLNPSLDTTNKSLVKQLDQEVKTFNASSNGGRIDGGSSIDFLYGDAGKDKLYGKSNDDLLFGGDGNDVLKGGSGNDILAGELGNDNLFGGTGSDLFILANDGGIDVIWDFELGQDLIQLSGGINFTDLKISQGTARRREGALLTTEDNTVIAVIADVNAQDVSSLNFI